MRIEEELDDAARYAGARAFPRFDAGAVLDGSSRRQLRRRRPDRPGAGAGRACSCCWWSARRAAASLPVRRAARSSRRSSSASTTSANSPKLRGQQKLWDDPAYIQQQARTRLQYAMPGDTVYVVVRSGPAARHRRSGTAEHRPGPCRAAPGTSGFGAACPPPTPHRDGRPQAIEQSSRRSWAASRVPSGRRAPSALRQSGRDRDLAAAA